VLAYGPPLLTRTEESVAGNWDILQAATGLDGDGMRALVERQPHSLLRSPGNRLHSACSRTTLVEFTATSACSALVSASLAVSRTSAAASRRRRCASSSWAETSIPAEARKSSRHVLVDTALTIPELQARRV